MNDDWHLAYDGGDLYHLYNTSGVTATSVEVTAQLLQLDGMGRDYVRRVPEVPNGDYIQVGLRRVFGSTDPRVTVVWTRPGTDARQQTTIRF